MFHIYITTDWLNKKATNAGAVVLTKTDFCLFFSPFSSLPCQMVSADFLLVKPYVITSYDSFPNMLQPGQNKLYWQVTHLCAIFKQCCIIYLNFLMLVYLVIGNSLQYSITFQIELSNRMFSYFRAYLNLYMLYIFVILYYTSSVCARVYIFLNLYMHCVYVHKV